MLTKSEPGSHRQRVASEPPRLALAMRTISRPCRPNLALPRAVWSCTLVKIDICPFQTNITRGCPNNNGNDEKRLQNAHQHIGEWHGYTRPAAPATDGYTHLAFYFFHSFLSYFDTILFGFLMWGNLSCLSCFFVSCSSYLSRFIMHARLEFATLSFIIIVILGDRRGRSKKMWKHELSSFLIPSCSTRLPFELFLVSAKRWDGRRRRGHAARAFQWATQSGSRK